MRQAALALILAALPSAAHAQMDPGMPMKTATKPSTELTLTGLGGKTKTYTPAEFKVLAHITVKVHNAHNNHDETYSGVPLYNLLAVVAPAEEAGKPKTSPNVQVVVAGATDNFHVVYALCDINPDCRNGQAIVADTLDGQPIAADGAFKLVLSEDKKPARWTRNLATLTVKAVTP